MTEQTPTPGTRPSPWGKTDRFFFPLGLAFVLIGAISFFTDSTSSFGLVFLCVGVVWISLGVVAVDSRRTTGDANGADTSGETDRSGQSNP